MRYLLLRWLAVLVYLSVFSVRQTSAAPKSDQPDDPNFSGAWALDLKASTSFETLMKQIGASLLERKYAASVKLKAELGTDLQRVAVKSSVIQYQQPVSSRCP